MDHHVFALFQLDNRFIVRPKSFSQRFFESASPMILIDYNKSAVPFCYPSLRESLAASFKNSHKLSMGNDDGRARPTLSGSASGSRILILAASSSSFQGSL